MHDTTYKWNLKNKTNKQKNKNRLTDTENKGNKEKMGHIKNYISLTILIITLTVNGQNNWMADIVGLNKKNQDPTICSL